MIPKSALPLSLPPTLRCRGEPRDATPEEGTRHPPQTDFNFAETFISAGVCESCTHVSRNTRECVFARSAQTKSDLFKIAARSVDARDAPLRSKFCELIARVRYARHFFSHRQSCKREKYRRGLRLESESWISRQVRPHLLSHVRTLIFFARRKNLASY